MRYRPPRLDKPVPRKRVLSDEEKQLWKNVVEENFVVESDQKITSETAYKIKEPEKKPEKKALLPDAITIKTSRSTVGSIQARLDLHGHTLESAYNALRNFISSAQARDMRMVLVITGKGREGASGTLRAMFPRWLDEANLKKYIISYENAALRHGGTGAWYVRIRKKKTD